MSQDLRRLAHRVLMPGFVGTSAPPWVLRAVEQGLGGVCLFGHNLADGTQAVRALTDRLHTGACLVALDEEGGIVSRLGVHGGGSPHVGAAALGAAEDVALTEAVHRQIGGDLRRVGVDVDLAPVADVTSDPDNPVIGVRAFGTDPTAVGAHVAAAVTGLQSAGIAACAKHFPGHGDTAVDSHLGLPRIDADEATLLARDLPPFAAAVDAGVRAVMTAHIVFDALDPQPATLSAPVLALLRDRLGFAGAILTDAVDMRAVADTVGIEEAAVRSLAAGADLVCLGNPVLGTAAGDDEALFTQVLEAALVAVSDGRLPVRRLVEAADRVDALHAWVLAHRAAPVPAPSTDADERAARASLRTLGDVAGALTGAVHVLDVRRRRNVAAGRTATPVVDELLRRLPRARRTTRFAQGSEHGGAVETMRAGSPEPVQNSSAADGTPPPDVVLTASPWMDPQEHAALTEALRSAPDAVVVCTGWATADADLAGARRVVRTWGDSLPTARAVADLLVRE